MRTKMNARWMAGRVTVAVATLVVLLIILQSASAASKSRITWFMDKLIQLPSAILNAIVNFLISGLNVLTAPMFIFTQVNPCVYASTPCTAGGTTMCCQYKVSTLVTDVTITMPQDQTIKQMNMTLLTMITMFYVFMIMGTGIYLIFMSGSPHGRANAKDTLVRLTWGMMIVSLSPIIFQFMTEKIVFTMTNGMIQEAKGGMTGASALLSTFTDARYCCLVFMLIATSALAGIIAAFRYFLIYIMACFFPLIMFMYYTDLPNPLISLRGLGTRFLRFTILLMIVQVMQVMFLSTGIIIATDYHAGIFDISAKIMDFLLIFGAFIGVLFTPLLAMQLMEWVGAVMHLSSSRPGAMAGSRFVATWMRTGSLGTAMTTSSTQYLMSKNMGEYSGGGPQPSVGISTGIQGGGPFSMSTGTAPAMGVGGVSSRPGAAQTGGSTTSDLSALAAGRREGGTEDGTSGAAGSGDSGGSGSGSGSGSTGGGSGEGGEGGGGASGGSGGGAGGAGGAGGVGGGSGGGSSGGGYGGRAGGARGGPLAGSGIILGVAGGGLEAPEAIGGLSGGPAGGTISGSQKVERSGSNESVQSGRPPGGPGVQTNQDIKPGSDEGSLESSAGGGVGGRPIGQQPLTPQQIMEKDGYAPPDSMGKAGQTTPAASGPGAKMKQTPLPTSSGGTLTDGTMASGGGQMTSGAAGESLGKLEAPTPAHPGEDLSQAGETTPSQEYGGKKPTPGAQTSQSKKSGTPATSSSAAPDGKPTTPAGAPTGAPQTPAPPSQAQPATSTQGAPGPKASGLARPTPTRPAAPTAAAQSTPTTSARRGVTPSARVSSPPASAGATAAPGTSTVPQIQLTPDQVALKTRVAAARGNWHDYNEAAEKARSYADIERQKAALVEAEGIKQFALAKEKEAAVWARDYIRRLQAEGKVESEAVRKYGNLIAYGTTEPKTGEPKYQGQRNACQFAELLADRPDITDPGKALASMILLQETQPQKVQKYLSDAAEQQPGRINQYLENQVQKTQQPVTPPAPATTPTPQQTQVSQFTGGVGTFPIQVSAEVQDLDKKIKAVRAAWRQANATSQARIASSPGGRWSLSSGEEVELKSQATVLSYQVTPDVEKYLKTNGIKVSFPWINELATSDVWGDDRLGFAAIVSQGKSADDTQKDIENVHTLSNLLKSGNTRGVGVGGGKQAAESFMRLVGEKNLTSVESLEALNLVLQHQEATTAFSRSEWPTAQRLMDGASTQQNPLKYLRARTNEAQHWITISSDDKKQYLNQAWAPVWDSLPAEKRREALVQYSKFRGIDPSTVDMTPGSPTEQAVKSYAMPMIEGDILDEAKRLAARAQPTREQAPQPTSGPQQEQPGSQAPTQPQPTPPKPGPQAATQPQPTEPQPVPPQPAERFSLMAGDVVILQNKERPTTAAYMKYEILSSDNGRLRVRTTSAGGEIEFTIPEEQILKALEPDSQLKMRLYRSGSPEEVTLPTGTPASTAQSPAVPQQGSGDVWSRILSTPPKPAEGPDASTTSGIKPEAGETSQTPPEVLSGKPETKLPPVSRDLARELYDGLAEDDKKAVMDEYNRFLEDKRKVDEAFDMQFDAWFAEKLAEETKKLLEQEFDFARWDEDAARARDEEERRLKRIKGISEKDRLHLLAMIEEERRRKETEAQERLKVAMLSEIRSSGTLSEEELIARLAAMEGTTATEAQLRRAAREILDEQRGGKTEDYETKVEQDAAGALKMERFMDSTLEVRVQKLRVMVEKMNAASPGSADALLTELGEIDLGSSDAANKLMNLRLKVLELRSSLGGKTD